MNLITAMILLFSSLNAHLIFDFNKDSNINRWVIVDDVVMGGRSFGNFELNNEGHGAFYGNISLENNGGFSSLRYQMDKTSVNDFTKVVLRVKGDGKDYQFRIKADTRDRYSYIAPFSTNGKWQEIEIPLKNMYPGFRGRRLNLPNFSHEYISEITFLIGNNKPEEFKLLIERIELR
jgi:hypothetical protein